VYDCDDDGDDNDRVNIVIIVNVTDDTGLHFGILIPWHNGEVRQYSPQPNRDL